MPATCAFNAAAMEMAYFSAGESCSPVLKLTEMSLITTLSYLFTRRSSSADRSLSVCGPGQSSAKDTGGRSRTQSLQLLKPPGDVAKDCGHPQYAAGSVGKWQYGEFNRDARAVFAQRRHCKNIPRAKSRLSGSHRFCEAVPMALPKVLRDDYVERFSQGFGLGKSKNSLRTFVPKSDDTLRICIDDGIGRLAYERSIEPINVRGHGVTSR